MSALGGHKGEKLGDTLALKYPLGIGSDLLLPWRGKVRLGR